MNEDNLNIMADCKTVHIPLWWGSHFPSFNIK